MPRRSKLTVLSVAYPLAPVGPDAVGGAEQVLSAIDRALVAAGHRSVVVALEGSTVEGTLEATELPGPEALDEAAVARQQARTRAAIARVMTREPVDVVHLHGIDFWATLPPPGPPALATLHLPLDWYPPTALAPSRPRTFLHGVSRSQVGGRPGLLAPIGNGVDVAGLVAPRRRGCFALMLARLCPEKGVHIALQAAHRAGTALLIGGSVFPYPAHLEYVAREVRPLLDRRRRWLGPVGFERKRRLLAGARAVLIPSLAPETSSLVAMEAAAAGTPVIAFAAGALPEIVEQGRTGFLVADEATMADALGQVETIDPEECRAVARRRFSLAAMTGAYLERYAQLAAT